MSGHAAEMFEAVLLLHDLGNPVELISSQLELTAAQIAVIVKTGKIPVRQKKHCSLKPVNPKKHT